MRQIEASDFVASVAAALQYVSFTHPPDFVRALRRAHDAEAAPAARNALLQLLVNSKLSAWRGRPMCQDTGVASVYVSMGTQVVLRDSRGRDVPGLSTLVDQAVAMAYTDPRNPLRATVVSEPLGRRANTRDNTPGLVEVELVAGDRFEVTVAAKGGGGDVKARFKMLTPSDSVADWIVGELPKLGAGWCPPGVLGVGIGGVGPERTMQLAKRSLFSAIDIDEIRRREPANDSERLRVELWERINALGIGAQGLGGATTVLDVKVLTAPCHAAMLPVAIVPNCAATRFVRFELDGSGPAEMPEVDYQVWAGIPDALDDDGIRVDLDTLSADQVRAWRAGQRLRLCGRLLTARDAAHKRLAEILACGGPLPVDLRGRVIYYVGPVRPVAGEVSGPAGPTTSSRMDKFLPAMLANGVLATIGKAERTRGAVDSIRRHGSAYLVAVGGAALLAARSIVSSRIVAFEDLGMEAIYEFVVKDMPVTVAIDAGGQSIHRYIPITAEY